MTDMNNVIDLGFEEVSPEPLLGTEEWLSV